MRVEGVGLRREGRGVGTSSIVGSRPSTLPKSRCTAYTRRPTSYTSTLTSLISPHKPQTLQQAHPGGNTGGNIKSISHRCNPVLVAFVWELTEETVDLPLGCLQGGVAPNKPWLLWHARRVAGFYLTQIVKRMVCIKSIHPQNRQLIPRYEIKLTVCG